MSNLTTDIYELLIKYLVNENESLKSKLKKAEELAESRLQRSADEFDKKLRKDIKKTPKDYQWKIYYDKNRWIN